MFKFDYVFRNMTFNRKKSINSVADMVSYTPQFKHKNNQKSSTYYAEMCWILYVPM